MTFTKNQLAAITAVGPRIVVCAGPGSGKTTVLVEHIKHLAFTGVDPSRIVCITLTNAAAREIAQRLDGYGEIGYIGTLHGFCLKVIAREYGNVTVMEPEVACQLATQVMKECGIRISLPELDSLVLGGTHKASSAKAIVAKAYLHRQCMMKAFDYASLLRIGSELVHKSGELYDHLLIDEAQDHSLFDWVIYNNTRIANRFAVGDPDQSIFSFRGADIGAFLEEIKGSVVFTLEENHRSTNVICTTAQKLISNNTLRFPKSTFSNQDGGNVSYWFNFMDTSAMATAMAEEISAGNHQSYAVLCRYNEAVREMQDALLHRGIAVSEHNSRQPKDWQIATLLVGYAGNPCDALAEAYLRVKFGYEVVDRLKKQAQANFSSLNSVAYNLSHDLKLDKVHGMLKYEGFCDETLEAVETLAQSADSVSELAVLMHNEGMFGGSVQVSGTGDQDVKSFVEVTTIHKAKGREWDCVFVPYFNAGVFPSTRNVEEDRRLAYVAFTRARRQLVVLSGAQSPASPFVQEAELDLE